VRFFDDKPDREFACKPAPVGKPVVVVNSLFFTKRGETPDQRLTEFSQKMWDEFLQRFAEHHIVLVIPPCGWLGHRVEEFAKLGINSLVVNSTDVLDTSSRLRAMLEDFGIHLRPGTERQVSYSNASRYVTAGTLVYVGPDAFAVAGVEPDKEKTFEDMVRERQRTAWP
jgi:hypothetical protein